MPQQIEIIDQKPDLTDLYWNLIDVGQDNFQRVKLLPASEFQELDRTAFRMWCHNTARYGIPTKELVSWLKKRIKGKSAIEIGAGSGNLGYHLGITQTDSDCQSIPEVRDFYAAIGQPTIILPPEVVVEDAITAVSTRKPQVVIASWVTHKFDGNSNDGNVYGPDEEQIINQVESYIFIGNTVTHQNKPILKLPHKEYKFPWLVSRAKYPEENVIWVWGNHLDK